MEVFPGITVDAEVHFGKPCVFGTRVDVAALGAGETFDSVERDHQLTHGQVLAALQFAGHVVAHVPPAVSAA